MQRFTEEFARLATGLEAAVIVLWIGLAALTITLFVLSRTRWGQERPLHKCLLLSVLAHVLFIGYATTIRIVAGIPARDPEPIMHVSLNDGDPLETDISKNAAQTPSPWTSHHPDVPADIDPLNMERTVPVEGEESARHSQAERSGLTRLSPMDRVAMASPVLPEPGLPRAPSENKDSLPKDATPIDAPEPQRRETPQIQVPNAISERGEIANAGSEERAEYPPVEGVASSLLREHLPLPHLSNVPVSVEPNAALAGPTDTATAAEHGRPVDLRESTASTPSSNAAGDIQPSPVAAPTPRITRSADDVVSAALPGMVTVSPVEDGSDKIGPPVLGEVRRHQSDQEVPRVYRLRVAPNRSEIALRYGATNESEAAVRAALKWLADNQERDGRWNPLRHNAGSERRVLGRDRFGAGAQADTGISALAMLAFLASGHTHEEGLYRENVRGGLEFLLRSQATDGNLGGRASTYAFMYCHAMATLALSEAYGMTGDRRLEGAVRRAIMYTVTAQNPSTGGWRYNVGDEGDTSQLGWQLMALKSADLAGIPMPTHTRQGAIRYLESVSSGRFGGLAAYRPVEAPSRPMTAEALACRHFLGIPPSPPMAKEAADYLLAEVPGEGDVNFYYWYYATLGLYQTQSGAWEQWNTGLQKELLALQKKSGDLAGSWNPDTVWGGYGGRVYTTALATLCLEVYYRFMPIYVEAAAAGRTLR